jgi:hypothetical protein
LRSPRDALYPQKFALTSPTSGGRSVGIVRSLTKAKEILVHVHFCVLCLILVPLPQGKIPFAVQLNKNNNNSNTDDNNNNDDDDNNNNDNNSNNDDNDDNNNNNSIQKLHFM